MGSKSIQQEGADFSEEEIREMLRKKILFAMDYDILGQLQNSFFYRSGFRLLIAESGPRVFELLEEERPDLIILPQHLTGISGIECCRRLKADPFLRSIPLMLVVDESSGEQDCRADRVLLRSALPYELLEAACALLNIEKRGKDRFHAALECELSGEGDFHLASTSINLSAGGIFIPSRALLPVGEELQASIRLPAGEILRIRCRIAWVNHPEWVKKTDLPPGFGVEFLSLDEPDRTLLDRFLSRSDLEPFY